MKDSSVGRTDEAMIHDGPGAMPLVGEARCYGIRADMDGQDERRRKRDCHVVVLLRMTAGFHPHPTLSHQGRGVLRRAQYGWGWRANTVNTTGAHTPTIQPGSKSLRLLVVPWRAEFVNQPCLDRFRLERLVNPEVNTLTVTGGYQDTVVNFAIGGLPSHIAGAR